MLGQGLKNFFISLKHFFTPLGTLCLGMIFGLSVLIPMTVSAVHELTDALTALADGVAFDPDQFVDTLLDAVLALDWSDPLKALGAVLDEGWLTKTFEDCAGVFFGDVPALLESAAVVIGECIAKIARGIIIFLFFTLLGLVGGYFLLKAVIRHNIAKRALWKYFLVSFLDALLTTVLIGFCGYLFTLWTPSVIITTFVSLMLFGFISLVEAYVVHGNGKIPVKKVINGKNILLLPLTNLLIFVISSALTSIAVAITNQFVGLFVGLSLLEIAFLVCSMNAEAYVKNAIERTHPQKTPTTES